MSDLLQINPYVFNGAKVWGLGWPFQDTDFPKDETGP